jgi:hypothetical protein
VYHEKTVVLIETTVFSAKSTCQVGEIIFDDEILPAVGRNR